MKVYTLKVVIKEGYDEWWEEITKNNKSGSDEVRKAVDDALFDIGFQENCTVTLERYSEED